ncbi:MAG TPA: phBC6A51 family helix-turn-helix protein [Bacilli bacterium]|nr:phBC6A51 family helix-turn-helix protein [Bacilli bacterium]
MSEARRKRDLERQLSPQQIKAAAILVQNEWDAGDGGKKKTRDQIAEAVGISRSTLFEWLRKPEFVEYMNVLTDMDLQAIRSEFNALLVKAMRGGNNGIPSVKALDLYARRFGLLKDHVVTETVAADKPRTMTEDEMDKALNEIAAMGKR